MTFLLPFFWPPFLDWSKLRGTNDAPWILVVQVRSLKFIRDVFLPGSLGRHCPSSLPAFRWLPVRLWPCQANHSLHLQVDICFSVCDPSGRGTYHWTKVYNDSNLGWTPQLKILSLHSHLQRPFLQMDQIRMFQIAAVGLSFAGPLSSNQDPFSSDGDRWASDVRDRHLKSAYVLIHAEKLLLKSHPPGEPTAPKSEEQNEPPELLVRILVICLGVFLSRNASLFPSRDPWLWREFAMVFFPNMAHNSWPLTSSLLSCISDSSFITKNTGNVNIFRKIGGIWNEFNRFEWVPKQNQT